MRSESTANRKGAAEAAPLSKIQNLLLRLRSRTQRNVAALLRRSLSLFLLVGHPRLVARRGGRLFLLGSIAGQAQWTGLCLAVGNLGGVWRGRSLSVRYRPFGFMLLGFLGALAEARTPPRQRP